MTRKASGGGSEATMKAVVYGTYGSPDVLEVTDIDFTKTGQQDHTGHRPDLPLSDAPEAIRYLETGHARGKIVITVSGASQMMPDTGPD